MNFCSSRQEESEKHFRLGVRSSRALGIRDNDNGISETRTKRRRVEAFSFKNYVFSHRLEVKCAPRAVVAHNRRRHIQHL